MYMRISTNIYRFDHGPHHNAHHGVYQAMRARGPRGCAPCHQHRHDSLNKRVVEASRV